MEKNGEHVVWKDRRHIAWFPITFDKYRIENGRLYTSKGLFNTVEDECLLYRITDIRLKRTFGNKIFGTGTVCITARDVSDSHMDLKNIKKSREVTKMLSSMVEDIREEKKLAGRELYGSADHPGHMDHGGDSVLDLLDDDIDDMDQDGDSEDN